MRRPKQNTRRIRIISTPTRQKVETETTPSNEPFGDKDQESSGFRKRVIARISAEKFANRDRLANRRQHHAPVNVPRKSLGETSPRHRNTRQRGQAPNEARNHSDDFLT